MKQQLKELYELNNSLLLLAENLQDEFNKKGIKEGLLSADLFTLCFFFAKSSKTASAVVMLCQEGYAEDACILVRTIFEIVVKSFYIFKSDSIERARAFILYDKLELKKRLKKIVDTNRERLIENKEFEEELRKVEAECSTLEKDFRISKEKLKWPKKNLEELCKEVDLVGLYRTIYWISSLYVHTLIRSSQSFVSRANGGLSFYIGPNEKLSQDVLIWLFDSFRQIVKEFDSRFNLGYQEKISAVEERFGKFMQSVINEK